MRTLEGQAPSLPAARLQAILFEHDDVMYALDARAVVEILWLSELSPVVEMPHFVVGAMNYRGRTLPVVDLLRRVGRASAPYQVTDQLVVVESRAGLYAIIVEMVRDVVSIDPDDVQPTEALSSGGVNGSRVISHAINRESAVVMLLDHDAILPTPDSSWSDDRPSADPFPSRLEHLPVDARATLRERATELAARPESDDEEDALALAIIRIGDDRFGIDVSTVELFARCPAQLTPVPCTPDHVRGRLRSRVTF
jgi:purine-binding chemotaxis protein CheW